MTFYGLGGSITFLMPPVLSPNEVYSALLWDNTNGADLDLHLMSVGNATVFGSSYPGAVDWQYADKTEAAPFASWTEISSNVYSGELIHISQLNKAASYEFMAFLYSRINGGDNSITWGNTHPSMYLYGGSATGLGYAAWYTGQPTPPAGYDYGYWSPFSLEPTGSGLDIVDDLTPFDPPISLANITARADNWYPCHAADSLTCPYLLP